MKSARTILRENLDPDTCGISFSLLEKIMEEYAVQFKPIKHKKIEFDSYRLKRVLEEVCSFFGVTETELASKSRKRDLTDARAVFARRCKSLYPDASWSKIAALINKDHATTIQARRRAHDIKEIQLKYNKCYAGETEIAYSIMASAGGTGIRSVVKTSKGPLVSYGKMEKKCEGVPEKEPALQDVRSTG